MRQNNWTWAALVLLALVGLTVFLNAQFPGALREETSQMRLVYLTCLLAFVLGSMGLGWRRNAGVALKQALAWIGIALILVVIYTARDDLMGLGGNFGSRVVSSLAPTKPVQVSGGVVYLSRAARDNHFRVDAVANGHVMNFLIDTGASDVALSSKDAQRLGFDLARLNFAQPYQTANGVTMGATVTLDSIQVGDITVHNVRGSVMQGDTGMSLLGMSFLNALGSYEFSGERLILRR
jgi:aspartyl protease family protein